MNLALRDIRHNLGRFLLTCLGLSLLLGVVLGMIGIYRGLVEDALGILNSAKPDIWVVEAGSRGPFAESSRLPGDVREIVARQHGVAEAGSVTYQSAEAEFKGGKLRLYVIGYELGRMGGPPLISAGRSLARSHYELVADIKSGLKIGDNLRLGRKDFSVVGLTERQVASGGDPVVYMSLADSQVLQFELEPSSARREAAKNAAAGSRDTVNAVIARLESNADIDMVAGNIRRWKHLSVLTAEEQANILTMSVVDKARKQIGLFTITLMTVSAVVIALIIYTLTMDKKREIATLKLIGAPDRTIIGLILTQAISMGGIGFLTGASIILTVKDYFPRRVVVEAPDIAMLGMAVAFICVLASLSGVRYALRIDPATALGG
jgi:putative ABC transport system permease protein